MNIHPMRKDPPGMYISLFHGREDPKQAMEDWGANGPFIGPVHWVHVTYMSSIRFAIEDPSPPGYPKEAELNIVEDLIVYEGMYYGDWEIIYHNPETTEKEGRTHNRLPTLSG